MSWSHMTHLYGRSPVCLRSWTYEVRLISECLVTRDTLVRSFSRVFALMSYEVRLISESLVTRDTLVRSFIRVFALMSYEVRLV